MKSTKLPDTWKKSRLFIAISPNGKYVMVDELDENYNLIKSQGNADQFFREEVERFLKFISYG